MQFVVVCCSVLQHVAHAPLCARRFSVRGYDVIDVY